MPPKVGCFTVKVRKSSVNKDISILKRIPVFFGVGALNIYKNDAVFTVTSVKDLVLVVLPHFESYPLLTQKLGDFLLFKQVVLMLEAKEHSSLEGVIKIIGIKSAINLGLSESLINSFPGFVDGDGCFHIVTQKTESSSKVWLAFQITQHSRDTLLMESIVKYLGCGKVYNRNSTPALGEAPDFRVYNLDTVSSKIIPFFLEHKLQSVKSLDFDLFREACVLLLNGDHRTPSGLEKVNNLKSRMNKSYNTEAESELFINLSNSTKINLIRNVNILVVHLNLKGL
ncbi:putative uncharacterized 49.1 kda protein in nd3 [Botrytis fragariae]|uniref:Uncharacterized 49.1 kDa protein in nd3 n=1 Tax=Botrytis fragariae TaxID=1964551 RepID=A0A8H6AIR6_9HELO|nr:putative uncharacterized 49.1 kda protein in nd3 [Botrytis fragariae]KAF5868402.1 putative uncharacterized 49.1 kda protein in nd3 [Botrytis fragariae]